LTLALTLIVAPHKQVSAKVGVLGDRREELESLPSGLSIARLRQDLLIEHLHHILRRWLSIGHDLLQRYRMATRRSSPSPGAGSKTNRCVPPLQQRVASDNSIRP